MPGDNLTVTIELGKQIAMEAGQRFAIRYVGQLVLTRDRSTSNSH